VVEVRRILTALVDDVTGRCVVRWGETYQSAPVDGMHFEIDASLASVARVAARLREEEELMAAIDKIEALFAKQLQDIEDLLTKAKLVENERQPWETEQRPPRSIAAVLADIEKATDPRPAAPSAPAGS
jgi:hypothetical protein